MADKIVPHFLNEAGVHVIEIGVREFMCMGAKPPNDHPHIFVDMGEENEGVCGYCATLYRYRPDLHADETVPPGQLYIEAATAA
jgi:uncharacterized Zn-finger protein